ncbi:amino acid ABC transporter substrate-binding protein [Pseudorhodoplanes sp.]|uniref:amino acid ABC transporter substrate-binding protein n=1 Tax=Pseudorhodoplanes sp. TaxID=1934341 RepID=UPI00391BC359
MNVTLRTLWGRFAAFLAIVVFSVCAASAQTPKGDPIKVGFSMSLTGAVAPNGQQLLKALEIWRDDVNAAGGLLGRPVELIHYDDQSSPANVPAIYQKLLSVDKVDLLLGPYATNMAAPAMPVIMQAGKTTITMLAIGVNRHFNYDRYFSMVPVSTEGVAAFSRGFFELAAAQNPKPVTVAMVAADAEFARTAADGAKENAKKHGFKIVYDRSYPPHNTDFAPVMRAVQAANPDIVFVAAYPPDTVGIVRAAHEIGLKPKMFGGTMIGLLATPLKAQLGPLTNNLVIMESFTPAFKFSGLEEVLAKYRQRAAGQKIDPFGYGFVPFGYAAGQILAKAVTETNSLDHDRIAKYIHANSFDTVAGPIKFGKDGEWAEPRTVFSQFQNVEANNVEQFRDGSRQPVLWPEKYRTGTMIYPYAKD